MQRRAFLAGRSLGGVAVAGCLGSATDDGSGDNGSGPCSDGGSDSTYGGWFEGVGNYDGTVDETGRERVNRESRDGVERRILRGRPGRGMKGAVRIVDA